MIAWIVCAYLCTGMVLFWLALEASAALGRQHRPDAPVTLHAQILTVAVAALFWPAFVIIASR